MFERFTDRARRVVVLSQEEAQSLGHNYIGTEHLLLGLIHVGEGVAAKALESLSISHEIVRSQVIDIIGQGGSPPTGHVPFTPRAKKVFELSLREALQLGHNYIGTEHILLGLIREGEGVAAQVLVATGADLKAVRHQVIKLLSGYPGPEPPIGGAPLSGLEALDPDPGYERWMQARRVLSQRSRGVLERALGEAMAEDAAEIEPEHLLLALTGEHDGSVEHVLRACGVDPNEIRRRLSDGTDDGEVSP